MGRMMSVTRELAQAVKEAAKMRPTATSRTLSRRAKLEKEDQAWVVLRRAPDSASWRRDCVCSSRRGIFLRVLGQRYRDRYGEL